MSSVIANPAIRSLARGVVLWAPLWISTTFIFGLMGVVYVLFLKKDTYLASQALLVRDEATGAVMRLGRFQSQTEMKAAQETILEMAKSHQVIRDALLTVGESETWFQWFQWGEFPSKELVEEVAKSCVSVHAPKGVEFGVTEVIYLDVKSNDQENALALNKALCDSLESRLQQVRRARADGVVSELTNSRDSAKRELAQSSTRLREMESGAGSDLTDLRGMTDTVSGGSSSKALFDQIRNEIRQAELMRQSLIADRDMLLKAADDPNSFIVAPGTLLNSQPGLRRLREGLVDSQLVGSQLAGRFTENHPLYTASRTTQNSIAKRFLQELKASVASVESEIELIDSKIKRLSQEQLAYEGRLSNLADSRSTYANLLSEVRSKVAILEAAEKELAEAQAARDSAVSTSLLTRLDAPSVSDRPLGPGRTTIAGLCTIAGLVFGMGIVFIITPIDVGPSFGRRSSDRYRNRRADADANNSEDSNQVEDQPRASQITSSDVANKRVDTKLTPELMYDKLNLQSANDLKETKDVVSANQTERELLESYQPMIKPPTPKVIAQLVSNSVIESSNAENQNISSRELDLAFQEFSKLQSAKPESRTEELALQMKLQELKLFLSSNGVKTGEIQLKNGSEHPRLKPRPVRQK